MTDKKNTSLIIGAFIMGAIVLVFVALIFFSGGRLFSQKEKIVMYFDGSVQGLQIGAPVKLKGVVLGEITDIQINFQSDDRTVLTAVTAELVMKRINRTGKNADSDFFEEAINAGLRAQLNFQSFLTGLLYVELDYYPNSEVKLYALQDSYRELPTVATQLEEISKTLQDLNLKGIARNIDHLILEATKLVDSGEVQRTIVNFGRAANSIEATSQNLNTQVTALSADLGHTRQQLDKLLNQLNTQTPVIAASINANLVHLQQSLEQFDRAASSINNTFAEDAPLVNQLTQTLNEVSRSAQAFRILSETLDQQPESILRGRSQAPNRE